MNFVYPIDVSQLVHCVRQKSAKEIHLPQAQRDDQRLTAVVWGLGHGWFPLDSKRQSHFGVDIGVPKSELAWMEGASVKAIGAGKVSFVQSGVYSKEGLCLGRVIIEHQASGVPFLVLYQHIEPEVYEGQHVKAGEHIGKIGPHDDFPHLHLAALSSKFLAAEPRKGLDPKLDLGALPKDDAVWDVLTVKVDQVDDSEWPVAVHGPAQEKAVDLGGPVFLYNPIELIRFLNDEEELPDVGSHLDRMTLAHAHQIHDLKSSEHNEHEHPLLHSKKLAADRDGLLKEAALGPKAFKPIHKGSNATSVRAVKEALDEIGEKGFEISGVYGDGTVSAVKRFQKSLVKPERAALIEDFGLHPSDVPHDGKVDWFTLMALDACHAVFEQNRERERKEKKEKERKREEAPKEEEKKEAESAEAPPEPPPDALPDDPAATSCPFCGKPCAYCHKTAVAGEAPAAPVAASTPTPSGGTSADLGGDWVFDATPDPATGKPRQSLKFGLRLYAAMLDWELQFDENLEVQKDHAAGCLYSTNGGWKCVPYRNQYDAFFTGTKDGAGADLPHWKMRTVDGKDVGTANFNEWPRIDLTHDKVDSDSTLKVGGKEYKVYRCGNATWVATGRSNCCNTQLAAFFVAIGGKPVAVKTGSAAPVLNSLRDTGPHQIINGLIPYTKGGARAKVKKKDPATKKMVEVEAPAESKRVGDLFEKAMMVSSEYLDEAGKPVGAAHWNFGRGGGLSAMRVINAGDAVGEAKFTVDQETLKEVRIGDWASTVHHAWLVADVAYGVWLDGDTKPRRVYQSSFVASKDGASEAIRLDKSHLQWVAANEFEFMERVRKFVRGGKYQGKSWTKMEVVDVCMFSSNGYWAKNQRTIYGKAYKDDGSPRPDYNDVKLSDAPDGDSKEAKDKRRKVRARLEERTHYCGVNRDWIGSVPGSKKGTAQEEDSDRKVGPGACYARWYAPVGG
jgi:hypothetical protein